MTWCAGKIQRKHILLGAAVSRVAAVIVEGTRFAFVYYATEPGQAYGQQKVKTHPHSPPPPPLLAGACCTVLKVGLLVEGCHAIATDVHMHLEQLSNYPWQPGKSIRLTLMRVILEWHGLLITPLSL